MHIISCGFHFLLSVYIVLFISCCCCLKTHFSSSCLILHTAWLFFFCPTSCDYLHVFHLCWAGVWDVLPLSKHYQNSFILLSLAKCSQWREDRRDDPGEGRSPHPCEQVQCVNVCTGVCMRLICVFGSDLNFSPGRKQSLYSFTSVWIQHFWQ